ncbi:MAG: LCP family protein, partial [Syntrophomonadaceae bacterium]|nr:LCP family protein [Syntrophomonadaceae bacterium]
MKMNRQLVMVLVIIFALTFSTGILIGKNLIKNETIEEKVSKGKPINILVMGIDARSKDANSRSDTMILVSIDRNTKKIAMVWIPRDTRVEVGFNRYDKINSINYLKGPEAACDAVGKLLNTKVNYYAVVNFAGFVNIIDLLGGVHIDVDIDMKHYDPNPKLSINLSKGPQLLNGEDALRYVRYRGGPTADIGRTQRQ